MADRMQIRHPDRGGKGGPTVPLKFVAAGTAQGDRIKKVRGQLVPLRGGGGPIQGKHLYFVTRPGPGNAKSRWAVYFGLEEAQSGPYRLDVVGLDDQGAAIGGAEDSLELYAENVRGIVAFSYPPPNYTITGAEKDYFVAYGSTDRPILFAELGGQQADSIYDDLTISFWSAQFPPLTSSGTQTLAVTDADDSTAQESVVVD